MTEMALLRAALARAKQGNMRGHWPTRPNDDDRLLEAALDELDLLRAVYDTARVYTAPDTSILSDRMASSPYGRFLTAVRRATLARPS